MSDGLLVDEPFVVEVVNENPEVNEDGNVFVKGSDVLENGAAGCVGRADDDGGGTGLAGDAI